MSAVAIRRRTWLPLLLPALVVALAASLLVGSNMIPPGQVWQVLLDRDDSQVAMIVWEQRMPRTLVVALVGVALGVAGTLMQSLTNNPLADPGVLGVNAGAALAVVAVVALTGVSGIGFYMWFALLGAGLAAVGVYALGATGAATPAGLALAGVALSMAVSSLVQLVILTDQDVFNEFRFWAAGSAEGRGYPVLGAVSGLIVLGLVLALVAAPGLDAMALGDDTARNLGVDVARLRLVVLAAVTLLAGAATAAIGPIMFVGLGVPFIARRIGGSDMKWALPTAALVAPVVMLAADLVARVVVAPQEIQTGLMTAILGGPLFIAIVRRRQGAGRRQKRNARMQPEGRR